jgi:RNA polymerase sigma factor (sigma-70 family)
VKTTNADGPADLTAVAAQLHAGRERFLELVADIRPDLHRYCARMTGSVSAGEDVVQETLARAYYEMGEVYALPQLRSWLFHVAHQRSIDHLRRYDRRMGQPLEEIMNTAADQADSPEDAVAREEAVRAAISAFPRRASPAVTRYARLFNARDWDGVRAMLADDVHLDLVSRSKRSGKAAVGGYVTQYAAHTGWRLAPAWLDGQEVVAAFRNDADPRPGYFVELTLRDGLVTGIRDFRYVPYIGQDAAIDLSTPE